jgi:acyl-CoA synthetase (AMP-forming)/AMP-acid ligase II
VIIAGGEKMPIPFIERLRRTFPSAWFADAYGLTETVSGDTFLDRDSTVSKLGSCGRPCQYLELDIWDETGPPAGERGEVVRGARRCSRVTTSRRHERVHGAGSTPETSA